MSARTPVPIPPRVPPWPWPAPVEPPTSDLETEERLHRLEVRAKALEMGLHPAEGRGTAAKAHEAHQTVAVHWQLLAVAYVWLGGLSAFALGLAVALWTR